MIATPDLTEATLEWLNDLSPHGILITDAALIIRGWNRWMELHSGRRAVDVLGRSLLEAYPELVERRMDDAYRQALSGQTVVLAHRLHMYLLPMPPSTHELNFSQMQQSARITPLLRGGQVIGTLTTIDDVTERVVKERMTCASWPTSVCC
ncbi:MAG: hypothetical protein KatS3mg057_0143 [Herpetosiphonaceae bacterium]|nr:MAG: hypothetical protein KatS3mg057_0143 [Herpetosiphonaceae bacterium]